MDGRANQVQFEDGQGCLPTNPAGWTSQRWLPNDATDRDERRWAAPSSFARDDVARPIEKRAEPLEAGKRTTIDRIVAELADAESWERLARRRPTANQARVSSPART